MPKIGPVEFDGPIGFGTMSLSGNLYASSPDDLTEEAATAVIKTAYKEGVRLFNTSDLYGPYTNEELLGRALKGLDGVVVATKWGPMIVPGKGFVMDGSPENARACAEGALKRLDRASIDIFTMRGPEDPKVPIEVTFGEVKKLIEEGKVRAAGLSECNSEIIRRAHAVTPVSAIEMEYSLFSRDIEDEIIPLAKELGIAILAYSPLGRGMLTGTITSADQLKDGDFRKHSPRFQGDAMAKNLELVENVQQLAARKGCTPGQLALAWVLAKGRQFNITIIPIPGTKREKYLIDNMGALKLTLSDEEVDEIEKQVDASKVVGGRYPDHAATYQTKSSGHH